MKKTLLAVVVGLAALGLAQSACGQLFMFENPLIGKPAPEFQLDTVDGRSFTLSEWRQGRRAILFFWATWCPHCRRQLQELTQAQADLQKQGIALALVDLQEKPEVVQRFLEKAGAASFDCFLDQTGQVASQYKIMGVPTFFFIDEKGVVRAVEHYLPPDFASLFENKTEATAQ